MATSRPYATASTLDVMFDPGFPHREELLQFIWEQQLFQRKDLKTTDGEMIEVIKPGRLHKNSGPDLQDGQVRIGGQLWVGNIEIHVKSSEWFAHGHETDAAYNSVVLHVVFEHDVDIRTKAGARIPTLELKDRIQPERIAAYQELMHTKAWIPCASQFAMADHSRMPMWLERVLIERLERKCGEVETLYKQLGNDANETFWHVLARGFGLKTNAEPFGMLARALPLKILLKYRDDLFRLEALLFGQAGLLQVDFLDEYPRQLQEEHRILAALHELKPAPVAAWSFGRLRPPNFPTIRLAQLAQLIAKSDGAFSQLLEHDDPASILVQLEVEATGYWSNHYRFDQAADLAPKRLGRSSAEILIINTLVPYLFAMGRARGTEDLQDRALKLLELLPPEHNAILAGWAQLGLRADTAARSQALIELKNTFCDRRRCLCCAIGTGLLSQGAHT